MYGEKINLILKDIEDKNVEIAGGSVIGIILATINSLVKYIANLTLGKKKYANVQEEIKNILKQAEFLKNVSLNLIDADKQVLEELLQSYKLKNENNDNYIKICKKTVEFCLEVVGLAFKTLKLSDDISKIGNKMLESDFKICIYYSYASIQSAIVNVDINLKPIQDEEYKIEVKNKCNEILKKSKEYLNFDV